MADPTLYLFDGSNLFHAGSYPSRDALVDALASWVAFRGVKGVVVFDGVGEDRDVGPLAVRFAAEADPVLERLAASARTHESVVVVTSDVAVRGTAGQEVRKVSSRRFAAELTAGTHREGRPGGLRDRLDPATLERLERLRRGAAPPGSNES